MIVFNIVQIAEIAAIVLLLALSAFFSASETAYTSLSKPRLRTMDPNGTDRAVQRALANVEDYDRLLTTILIGNNIANIAASTISTALLISLWPDYGTLIATILMITVLLLVGEVTPKTYAKHNSERIAVRFSGAIHVFMVVLRPISSIFMSASHGISKKAMENSGEQAPSDEETSIMIDEILEEGSMEEAENKLIRSAMEFDDTPVGDICIPRVDIVAVSSESNAADVRDVFLASGYTRLPIYEGSIDHIIGYVALKDCLKGFYDGGEFSFLDTIRPVRFFPETVGLDEVFKQMQRSHSQIGIVLDEYGGTYGMVTTEDLIEELVGEIYDETDEEASGGALKALEDGSYVVSGSANMKDVMESLGLEFDPSESETVSIGGYIAEKLERIPRLGDRVDTGGAELKVKAYRNRRVKEVLIVPIVQEEPEPGDQGTENTESP